VQSHSQALPSHPLPPHTPARPSTASHGDTTARGRPRLEKDPNEAIGWMRSLTRAHRRRVLGGNSEDPPPGPDVPVYEAPPPPYNAIDFSTPPEARSFDEGAHD
jgi:hypothetical protein